MMLVRTGNDQLHRRIGAALAECDDGLYDRIDALIAHASELLSTIGDPREREDHAALCAVLLRRRVRMRFVDNDR